MTNDPVITIYKCHQTVNVGAESVGLWLILHAQSEGTQPHSMVTKNSSLKC